MNAVLQAMKERRSVRAYQDKPVPRDAIERICEAGTYAPTGMGFQSPIILAVTNRQLRDRLSAMNARIMGRDADPFYGAPVVLVVLANKAAPTYLYDGSLVMGNLMLAAHAEGLAATAVSVMPTALPRRQSPAKRITSNGSSESAGTSSLNCKISRLAGITETGAAHRAVPVFML